MARLALTEYVPVGGYPVLPVAANAADFAFAEPGVPGDGISFTLTGKEILLVFNSTAGALTVTINSVNDERNRSGDIAAYSVGANEYAAFGPFPTTGWRQSTGLLHAVGSAAGLKFAVVRPA